MQAEWGNAGDLKGESRFPHPGDPSSLLNQKNQLSGADYRLDNAVHQGGYLRLMKLKWLTSLIILVGLTGSVWAGVCGCFSEEHKAHSCCRKSIDGTDSMGAKGCCSADCETIIAAAGKTPQKQNADNTNLRAPANAAATPETVRIEWLARIVPIELARPYLRTGDNRLRLARGPDLYLRHNSFLI